MKPFEADLGLGSGLTTPMFGYAYAGANCSAADGAPTYPGRTFVVRIRRGVRVAVRWSSELRRPLDTVRIDTGVHWALQGDAGIPPGAPYDGPVPAVPHLHGGRVEPASDGHPEAWFLPDPQAGAPEPAPRARAGPAFAKRHYTYANEQEAATLWYHDHGLGVTRLNVYAGLAGFYLLRDERDGGAAPPSAAATPEAAADPTPPGLGLPAYPYELPIVIQDKTFHANGSLYRAPQWSGEFYGAVILANGKAWPVAHVEPRTYRIRLLNGCDSRPLRLFFSGADAGALGTADYGAAAGTTALNAHVLQIGGDLGLLHEAAPVMRDAASRLEMGPGERADLLVDFASVARPDAEAEAVLRNDAPIQTNRQTNGADPMAKAGGGAGFDEDLRLSALVKFVVGRSSGGLGPGASPAPPLPAPLRLDRRYARPPDVPWPASDLNASAPVRRIALGMPTGVAPRGGVRSARSVGGGGSLPLLGTVEGDPPSGRLRGRLRRWTEGVTEELANGTSEVWEIYNLTPLDHPIHLHLAFLQVIDRRPAAVASVDWSGDPLSPSFDLALQAPALGPAPNELGPKDTVRVPAMSLTRVAVTASLPSVITKDGWLGLPGHPAQYAWHCHMLSHEDNDMMRPMDVRVDVRRAGIEPATRR